MENQLWEVIGGEDKGGILVRDGPGLKSATLKDRLATGSIIEEQGIKSDRVDYKLIKGSGPEVGWVAMSVPGKPLLKKVDSVGGSAPANGHGSATGNGSAKVAESSPAPAAPQPPATVTPAKPIKLNPSDILKIPGGDVTKKAWTEYVKSWNGEVQDVPPSPPMNDYGESFNQYYEKMISGGVKPIWAAYDPHPEHEGPHCKNDPALEVLRERNAKLREQMAAEPPLQPLPPWRKFKLQEVKDKATIPTKGEMYGLTVPPDLSDLYKRGKAWLNDAFHAAGTLPKDNNIKQIIDFKRLPMGGIDAKGGSGPKAFITVEYEKFDMDLHNNLFVKMPWSVGGESHDMGGDDLWRWKISCFADNDGQEVTVYRMLGPLFPFKIPKYYFADICRCSTNFILITEQLEFGKKGKKDFEAMEIQPLAEKYFDFQLPPAMRTDMYFCLVRAQARMAAWDKIGMFQGIPDEVRGYKPESTPPNWEVVLQHGLFPTKLPVKMRTRKIAQGKALRDLWDGFLGKNAKKAYPKQFSEKKFLDALLEASFDAVGFKDDLYAYLNLYSESTGMMHSNLQSDNAYYWRNEDGTMDCGIIDWGGLGPGHVVNRFMGCITSCLGEVLDYHEDGLIQCFIDEYYKECGIWVDFCSLKRQWYLGLMSYIYSCGMNIQQEIYRQVPEEEWATITTLMDERTAGQWNTRCYVFMIFHLLKYLWLKWKRAGEGKLPCHQVFIEWRDHWLAKGLE